MIRIASVPDNPYAHLGGYTIRIGYYSKQDGLDCVWLVMPSGEYKETTDHDHLYRFFVVETIAEEEDLFGEHRAPLGRLST